MLRILCALCVLCAISSHATTLLVYGDSLSAGYQLAPEQSWPALLAARWQQQGVDIRLINASVSGETTQGGQARLAARRELTRLSRPFLATHAAHAQADELNALLAPAQNAALAQLFNIASNAANP